MGKLKQIYRKSLLYESKVEYATWAANHVQGCAHDCRFPCYAYNQARRSGRVKNHADWRDPVLVGNALDLLDREIPKYRDRIDEVHLCFVTDPFMFDSENELLIPEIKDMTLAIVDKLNAAEIRVTTLTKGYYPDGIFSLGDAEWNEYGITLVSLDSDFRKTYEPYASPYRMRIASLRALHEAGYYTWVSAEPYPTPNLDPKGNLDALLETISFVNKIVFGKTNYNPAVTKWPGMKDFYNECADKVIEFCQKKDIEYWIKDGTKTTAVA